MVWCHRVVLLCVFLTLVSLYRVESRNLQEDNKTDSTDGCKMNNQKYRPGEEWSLLGECIQYTCQGNEEISGMTCALVPFEQDSTCYLTDMDLTKHYPYCCPQIVCPYNQPQ